MDIERVVVHQGYNRETYENDLALVKLKSASAGSVIPLAPAAIAIGQGEPLEVTGWGATVEGGRASTQLRKATVPYASNEACNARSAYNGVIKPGMMCAGSKEGGVDSCQGDSGGPLVLKAADGPILAGVVSFGEGCARKLKYGVYTRVSAYREWIGAAIAADRTFFLCPGATSIVTTFTSFGMSVYLERLENG